MRTNYYKIIISLIFVTFLVTGCAQPGKKVKGFKHNTPLVELIFLLARMLQVQSLLN